MQKMVGEKSKTSLNFVMKLKRT